MRAAESQDKFSAVPVKFYSEEDFLIETLGLIKQSYSSYFLFCFS